MKHCHHLVTFFLHLTFVAFFYCKLQGLILHFMAVKPALWIGNKEFPSDEMGTRPLYPLKHIYKWDQILQLRLQKLIRKLHINVNKQYGVE